MKAEALALLKFLKSSPQLTIPIYQRTYSWSIVHCEQLWNDILRVGINPRVSAHFIGSIVYVEKDLPLVGSPSSLLVIDGQQRVTTVSILLEALARAVGNEEPEDGFSARKIRNHYLLDPEESGERRHKLLLTQTDKTTLLALTGQQPIPDAASVRVTENFNHFSARIAGLNGQYKTLCRGLAKLMIVEVALQRGQDNPQLIFESMNSTGLALSQADLIRNFVLMGQEPDEQTRLYQNYWRPMEERFGQEAYKWAFDGFMRHYLTFKTRRIPKIDAVYREFKAYLVEQDSAVELVLADIHAHAGHYAAMALEQEADPPLATAFADLRELQVDVAYPLLLELYHDYRQSVLSKPDFIAALRLVEAYVLRRAVCGVPTNTLNKTFASFAQSLDKSQYIESIKARFIGLSGRYRFPDDAEFGHGLKANYLYGTRALKFMLRRLENQGRKEPVLVTDYTIEHILPQNKDLSEPWRTALGPDWQSVQDTWLHTLGNLTLTGYNPEYSDRAFLQKRDIPGGFAQSPLRLNQGLGQLESWNEQTIKERAERLAQQALDIWHQPKLSAATLSTLSASFPVPESGDEDDEEPAEASG
jgi:uncharacterized protein with ParB-like and HNH nuclease domain